MARFGNKYLFFLFGSVLLLMTGLHAFAQTAPATATRAPGDTSQIPGVQPPPPQYGPYDTILVPAHVYQGEILSSRNMEYTFVTRPMPPGMRKRYEEWTRLRNAVYVTYPYARRAGLILNDISAKLALLNTEAERTAYVKSRRIMATKTSIRL